MGLKEEMNREYVQAYVPDKAKLAEYLNLAKGPHRTMAEFAEACSKDGKEGAVSASTFSRIANGHIKKPLSIEMIGLIINNAAEPRAFRYEELMRANGFVPKDERNQTEHGGMREFRTRSTERENMNRTIRNIMTDELLARGHSLMYEPESLLDKIPKSSFGLYRYRGFSIHMKGCDPLYWKFLVYFYDPRDIPEHWEEEKKVHYHMADIMNEWPHLFLADAWEPEKFKNVQHSIVFTDPEVYKIFYERIKKTKVNTWMSVILVDVVHQEVIEEKMIPRQDGKKFASVFDEEKKSFD